MQSTVRFLMLTGLIGTSGCGVVRIDGACPVLAAPPVEAVDALESARDPAVDAWVIALDRHYQKLDACAGK